MLKSNDQYNETYENHKYLFNVYGKSLQSEEGLENFAHDIRQLPNINLIVSIIVNIYASETIWIKYLSSYFVNVQVKQFRFVIYGLTFVSVVFLLIFITVFIQTHVLSPILEITKIMLSKKETA